MRHSFLFANTWDRAEARLAVAALPSPPDLIVTSPSDAARETAAYAVRGRWIPMQDEPLLAVRAPLEHGNDVLDRLAEGLRALVAIDEHFHCILVVVDGLDLLGTGAFSLTEDGAAQFADGLERAQPVP